MSVLFVMIPRKILFLLWVFCLPVSAQSDFSIELISDSVFALMKGKSYPADCSVKRDDLRYLRVMHIDGKGRKCQGELVCNKAIADDLIEIFKALYQARYPIERMQLIDNFDADDERSMAANNTSCFCYRVVEGSRKLSKHSLGLAIDINPRYNPCVKGQRVQPVNGKRYTNRSRKFDYKIERGDLLLRLFTQHGFRLGGSWRSVKDWQHFEK